ncbi:MAG: trimethylamine methyltransferase family protein [Anaerolineae bacterium]
MAESSERGTGPHFQVLSDEQMEEIHWATLELLRRTGVRVLCPEAREIFREAGCWVEGERVRIPPALVEWALAMAPSQVVLCNSRTLEPALFLSGRRTYYGPGADTPHIVDPYTGERRLARKQDVADGVRLVDALPHMDFAMTLVEASDVPKAVADLHHFQAAVENTAKPIIFTAWTPESVQKIVEMAEVVAGGPEALQQSPFCALYTEPTSPLILDRYPTEKLLYMARKGLPTVFTPGVVTGATGPVTLAGGLVQGNAEMLAGFVLAQRVRPGTPLIYGGGIASMDMRTTLMPFGAPEFMLANCALADLAHYRYRLPMWTFGGCTDAKTFDGQAVLEGALWVLLATLAGGNLVHDIGYIDNGKTTSLEMIVCMDEVAGLVRRITGGIEVTPETLALDVIHTVGPGGHFLAERHTVRHFRRNWFPTLLDRDSREVWLEKGAQTLADRVRARVQEILATHQPQPLDPGVRERLAQMVARATTSA